MILNKFFKISAILFSVFLIFPFSSIASTLYFLPQGADVYEGNSFIAEAGIDTEGKEVNAVDGRINFPGDSLRVLSIEKGGSAIDLWIKEPIFENAAGAINFSGGMSGGFEGQGTLFKIIFQSQAGKQAPFSAEVLFDEKTRVLLNDGNGTTDFLKFLAGIYRIKEKEEDLLKIISQSHPDQNIWYKNNTFSLQWDFDKDKEYSYLLSKDSTSDPDDIADKPEGDLVWMGAMSYRGLEDGIYYFHLREKFGTDADLSIEQLGKWSVKVSYRAMIDTAPPLDFTPEIAEIEGRKYLVFLAEDLTSGVDRCEVSEEKNWRFQDLILNDFTSESDPKNSKSAVVAASPYLLKYQDLQSAITVTAFDKAGNKKIAEFPLKKPAKDFDIYLFYGIIILLAAISYFISRFLWRKYFQRKKNHE